MILLICAKNDSLYCLPADKPEYLFGYWRFYPSLAEKVMDQDLPLLLECDLTTGPCCYIAAMISPKDGYGLTRRLLDAINPPPWVFVSYRRNIGDKFRFQWKKNSRRPRVTMQ